MRVPKLNRQLVLEETQRVPDGAGGFVQTWVALGSLWAEVKAGPGTEQGKEFATLSSVTYRITVRAAAIDAPSRPSPEKRFREGSRIFRILSVSEADAGADFLICKAREEVVA